nr:hypothetical protein [Tanacetum cinerariifolium]
FVDSVEAEIRRRRAEDIGYGVNTRVTELAAVQEQDTQDIYGVMEDTQGRKWHKESGPKANYKVKPNQAPSTTTTTVTNAQLQAMIDQGVNAALTARDANRTGDDNHTSGTGVRRTERVTRECT